MTTYHVTQGSEIEPQRGLVIVGSCLDCSAVVTEHPDQQQPDGRAVVVHHSDPCPIMLEVTPCHHHDFQRDHYA